MYIWILAAPWTSSNLDQQWTNESHFLTTIENDLPFTYRMTEEIIQNFNKFKSEGTTLGTSDLKSVYPTAGDNTWDWVATNYIRFCEYCCITIVHLQGDTELCKSGWDAERGVHAAHTTLGKKMDLGWARPGGDTPGPWPARWLAFKKPGPEYSMMYLLHVT
jgi:hypothetical protein